jgi:hypothetical protein
MCRVFRRTEDRDERCDARAAVQRQYATTDPLTTRMETHRHYEKRRVDLDAECRAALALADGLPLATSAAGSRLLRSSYPSQPCHMSARPL